MDLKQQFHQDLIRTYLVAKKKGYNATYFMRMVDDLGGVTAAKRLLRDNQVQEGLFHLAQLKLLRVSVENIVLNPKYDSLFSKSEKDAARARLAELGFEPGEWE